MIDPAVAPAPVLLLTGGSSERDSHGADGLAAMLAAALAPSGALMVRVSTADAPASVDRCDEESLAAWVMRSVAGGPPPILVAAGRDAVVAELVAACGVARGLVLVDPAVMPDAGELAGKQRSWLAACADLGGATGDRKIRGAAPVFSSEHRREWRPRIGVPVLLVAHPGVELDADAFAGAVTMVDRAYASAAPASAISHWRV